MISHDLMASPFLIRLSQGGSGYRSRSIAAREELAGVGQPCAAIASSRNASVFAHASTPASASAFGVPPWLYR
jgi:hypothetical protein